MSCVPAQQEHLEVNLRRFFGLWRETNHLKYDEDREGPHSVPTKHLEGSSRFNDSQSDPEFLIYKQGTSITGSIDEPLSEFV